MIKGIHDAAAGMISRMRQQETVSSNLANVNTTGYKSQGCHFSHEITSVMLRNNYEVKPEENREDFYFLHTDQSQGALTDTRNPLDVALAGPGFFTVDTGDSVGYTRNGNLSINAENELVNSQGHQVLGETGAIRITGSDVIIRESGEVVVDGQIAGRIRVVSFPDQTLLKRGAYGYFVPTEEIEPTTIETTRMQQGKLEKSNVDPVREMVQMIELNRAFEALQKAIHSQDETLRMATTEIAR